MHQSRIIHINLNEPHFSIEVLSFDKNFECPTNRFMIAFVAIDIPITDNVKFKFLLAVKEYSITPRRSSLCVILFFSFEIFVSWQKVDHWLRVC